MHSPKITTIGGDAQRPTCEEICDFLRKHGKEDYATQVNAQYMMEDVLNQAIRELNGELEKANG